MSHGTDAPDDSSPTCHREECDDAAAFWLFRPDGDRWRPRCPRHLVHLHPSIELKVWLESGYATPIELGRPDGPPSPPERGRGAAFREMVDEAMGWSA